MCVLLMVASSFVALGQEPGAAELDERYRELWTKGEYHEALDILQGQIDAREDLQGTRAYRYLRWISDRAELHRLTGALDESIADLEELTSIMDDPVWLLRLAEAYEERGRRSESRFTIGQGLQRGRFGSRFFPRDVSLTAFGRLSELNGENPKQIFSSFYIPLMENYPDSARVRIEAGNLAFRRGSYDLAEQYFLEALEMDEASQEAMLGLTRCYWRSSDPRLGETLERLLDANPNHCDAIAIEVERLLQSHELEAALERIDHGLSINPNHQPLRALLATIHYLQDERDAFQDEVDSILDWNPYASDAYKIPGRIVSHLYRFDEAAVLLEKAVSIDPEDHDARTQYALDLLRLGEEDEGRVELDAAFEADPFNVRAFNMLNLLDTLDEFATIEDGPFVVRMPTTETHALAPEALELLHHAYDTFVADYNVELVTPVHIQLFDNHDDFMVRSLGLPGQTGFLGICFGQLVTMGSPSSRPRGSSNWKSVLWHEFSHVITLQKSDSRMSRWLSEGISVYEETRYESAWGQRMRVEYKTILDEEELPGLYDLESYFTRPQTSNHLMFGYYIAGEFVRYYVDEYGMEALRETLVSIREGTQTSDALLHASGVDRDEFDDAWLTHIDDHFAPYDNLPAMPTHEGGNERAQALLQMRQPVRSWIDIPSPFTDAFREGMEAFSDEDFELAKEKMLAAHELFPDFSSPNTPLTYLAEMYRSEEDRAALQDVLWKKLQLDPADWDACMELIALARQEENWAEVIRCAEWAIGIDPFDSGIRNLLVKAYDNLQDYENAYQHAQLLAELDPAYAMDHELLEIDLLTKLERWGDARREAVFLLEEYPHLWAGQEMLLRIVENES